MPTHKQLRHRRLFAENLSTKILRQVGVLFVSAPQHLIEKGGVIE